MPVASLMPYDRWLVMIKPYYASISAQIEHSYCFARYTGIRLKAFPTCLWK